MYRLNQTEPATFACVGFSEGFYPFCIFKGNDRTVVFKIKIASFILLERVNKVLLILPTLTITVLTVIPNYLWLV